MYKRLATAQKVLTAQGYDTELRCIPENVNNKQVLFIKRHNGYSLVHSVKYGYRLYFTPCMFIEIDDINHLLNIMIRGV